jgi:hypothetical protein
VARLLAELATDGAGTRSSGRLCEVCAEVTGVSGAGIMLMAAEVPQGSLCTTDEISKLIEDLQYLLGQGPCVDAYEQDRVVSEPEMASQGRARWTAFSPPVVKAGVRALFGFPMRVGTVRMGAINLYRDTPGPLTEDQHADGLVMAGLAAHWVLDVQADAPSGSLAEELEQGADLRIIVHNAAGIVSIQLEVTITEALIRLRAYAFSHDRSLTDVAEDVVARRLRLP